MYDRSKFKPRTTSVMDDAQKQGRTNSRPGRLGYHAIEPGSNIFRLAPAKPDEDSWIFPLTRIYLEIEVDEFKDGQKTGKRILSNKPIFDARVHGPRIENESGVLVPKYKDIINEYKRFVENLAKGLDDVKKKAYLCHVTGYRDNQKKWVAGLLPNTGYITYAWKLENARWNLARLECNSLVFKKMQELAATEDSSESTIVVDPFTDPDNGLPIMITYTDSKEIAAPERYKVTFRRNPTTNQFDPLVLSDDQLIELEKQDSLQLMYVNVYTKKDFELAVEGLKRFDQKHNYGVFDNPDFISILEEVSEQFDEEGGTNEKPSEQDSQREQPINTKIKASSNFLSTMDRKALKEYIIKNELNITVIKAMSDDDIRDAIELQLNEAFESSVPQGPSSEKDLSDSNGQTYEDDLPF